MFIPRFTSYDHRESPGSNSSTGFFSPLDSKISAPAGWQSQLQPVVAMENILEPGM
jgi:hypothetical protein